MSEMSTLMIDETDWKSPTTEFLDTLSALELEIMDRMSHDQYTALEVGESRKLYGSPVFSMPAMDLFAKLQDAIFNWVRVRVVRKRYSTRQ